MSSWFCHLCHLKDFLGRLQKSAGHHMWPDGQMIEKVWAARTMFLTIATRIPNDTSMYIYIYMLVYHSQNLMPMRANPEKKALIASNRMSLPRFDSRWALGHSCLWQLSLLPLVSWVVAATTEALKVCTGSTSRVLRHGHIISSWKYRNMQNRIKHHQATSNTHITYTWYSA